MKKTLATFSLAALLVVPGMRAEELKETQEVAQKSTLSTAIKDEGAIPFIPPYMTDKLEEYCSKEQQQEILKKEIDDLFEQFKSLKNNLIAEVNNSLEEAVKISSIEELKVYANKMDPEEFDMTKIHDLEKLGNTLKNLFNQLEELEDNNGLSISQVSINSKVPVTQVMSVRVNL